MTQLISTFVDRKSVAHEIFSRHSVTKKSELDRKTKTGRELEVTEEIGRLVAGAGFEPATFGL